MERHPECQLAVSRARSANSTPGGRHLITQFRAKVVADNGEAHSNYWTFVNQIEYTPEAADAFEFLIVSAYLVPFFFTSTFEHRYIGGDFKFYGDSLFEVEEDWHPGVLSPNAPANPANGFAIETPLCVGLDFQAGRKWSRHYMSGIGSAQIDNEVELALGAWTAFFSFGMLLAMDVGIPIAKTGEVLIHDRMFPCLELLHYNRRRDSQAFGSQLTDRP